MASDSSSLSLRGVEQRQLVHILAQVTPTCLECVGEVVTIFVDRMNVQISRELTYLVLRELAPKLTFKPLRVHVPACVSSSHALEPLSERGQDEVVICKAESSCRCRNMPYICTLLNLLQPHLGNAVLHALHARSSMETRRCASCAFAYLHA